MDANGSQSVPVSRVVIQLLVTFLVIIVLLFVPAGTLDWPQAWWLTVVLLGSMVMAIVYVMRVNPDVIAARQKFGEGTKGWDLFIVTLAIVGIVAVLPAAGFEVRFGGGALPLPVILLGYVIYCAGFIVMTWAQGHNRHFEPTVRIQSDRDHSVVDTGPYAHVRHPGYISGSLFTLGMALALGSAWAVVPAVFTVMVLLVRTILEDRTLREELPGYADYARRVRYRWLPGIW